SKQSIGRPSDGRGGARSATAAPRPRLAPGAGKGEDPKVMRSDPAADRTRRRGWILALIAVVAGSCAALHRPPAVRGLPVDDPAAPFSAVWIGHATVLLRLGEVHLLTDPNLNGTINVVPRHTPPSVTVRELP